MSDDFRMDKQASEDNLYDRIERLERAIASIKRSRLPEFNGNESASILDDVVGASFISPEGEDAEPTSPAFGGMAFGAKGWPFGKYTFKLVAVESGALRVGINYQGIKVVGDYMDILNWFKTIGKPEDGRGFIYAAVYNPVDGCVYVGGQFTSLGGVAVSNIAKYDPTTKTVSALSTGLGNTVYSLAVDSTGLLYVGGAFTNAGGDANADNFCKWNGSAFSACGTAFGGAAYNVYALAVDPTNDNVYIGGSFINIGDANGDYIKKWNGSAYSSLSTGLNGIVRSLAVDSTGLLYVGGAFTNAGGDANADNFCKWNGSAFSACGTAFAGLITYPSALLVDASNNVYLAGTFTNIGDANGDYVTKWNGSTYSSLSTGLTSAAVSLAKDSTGNIYIGGGASGVYKWDGSALSVLDDGLDNSAYIAVDANDNIYCGGNFAESLTGRTLWMFASYGTATLEEILTYLLQRAGKSQVLACQPNNTLAASTARYTGPGRDDIASTTSNVGLALPMSGVIKNLRVRTTSAQPASGAMYITVYKNATPVMTATIPALGAAAQYTDVPQIAVSFAIGDRISFYVDNQATGVSANIGSISVEFY